MRKNKFSLPLSLLLLGLMIQIKPVSADFTVTSRIVDAWYADLDNDGKSDDIAVDVIFEVYNNRIYTDVDFYIGIELPSGYDFWFVISFTVKKYTWYEANGALFHLYNTALESGWYKASAVGFAEGDRFSYMDHHIFDPPGSNAGNPSASVFYYKP